ncbi:MULTISPECIES: glycosyltransferase family 2 protein [unclassified Agarivorans]|uniref:glycosyltransferase family 2 protein n=1 Tax=unclassified Agarivorans TaxID=2636026 RepID=UPI003D7E67B7
MPVLTSSAPMVSVIVPVFNTEAYLWQCLNSLSEQILQSIEVIVVIDASPDDSYQLVRKFSAQSSLAITLLNLKSNVGLAQARNIGIKHAQGRYLAFVDSDDFVAKAMYADLLQQALAQDADWVSCGFTKFSEQHVEQYQHREIIENTSVCNKLFKRQFVLQHALEFPVGEWFEDEIFSYMAEILATKVCHVEQPHYHYRHNPQGICRKPGADKQRLHARMCSIADFMQRIELANLTTVAAPLCLQMLCRHAFLQLRTDVSWSDLLCYWRFTRHLIDKYRLMNAFEPMAKDYFVASYIKWHKREWALWLLRLRAGKANYAVE